jgi:hypothetical protein
MRLRTLLLVPVASVAIYACSSSDPEPSGPPPGYEDVVLGGEVTDETLVAFVEALEQGAPRDVPSQAATLDWPEDGTQLPASTPPSFCWHIGGAARRDRGAPPDRWAGLEPVAPPPPAPASSPLRELLGPPRGALAHGAPFTGVATFLVLSTDGDPALLRALTSEVAFVPSQEAWDKVATAASGPITVHLVSAFFEGDRVTDGGPIEGSTSQITVAR